VPISEDAGKLFLKVPSPPFTARNVYYKSIEAYIERNVAALTITQVSLRNQAIKINLELFTILFVDVFQEGLFHIENWTGFSL
jgi:hypothetical protein